MAYGLKASSCDPLIHQIYKSKTTTIPYPIQLQCSIYLYTPINTCDIFPWLYFKICSFAKFEPKIFKFSCTFCKNKMFAKNCCVYSNPWQVEYKGINSSPRHVILIRLTVLHCAYIKGSNPFERLACQLS